VGLSLKSARFLSNRWGPPHISKLDDIYAVKYFGDDGPDIVRAVRDAAEHAEPSFVPYEQDRPWAERCRARFGRNGVAVGLLIKAWHGVPWRKHEGEPTDHDDEAVRVDDLANTLVFAKSQTWQHAFRVAGIKSEVPHIVQAWKEAGSAGEEIGGPNARILAAAMAGEMAQLSNDAPAFFLSLFHWVRAGHMLCGWDEITSRPAVF
jgi:hypothetical protein